MSKLRVHCFAISLDGYGAGPDQSREEPLGIGGEALHDWFVGTQTFQQMIGKTGGTTGVDDDFAARGIENVGAWIMGRHMFGLQRGPWPDDGWQGWWGKNPPYHADVFVLTHHAREPNPMEGGTTFHFVTEGIDAALERARASASGRDVRLLGGAGTIRQYLGAGLIDEMHVAISPIMLGRGEHLLGGIDTLSLGYARTEHVTTEGAMHFVLTKKSLTKKS